MQEVGLLKEQEQTTKPITTIQAIKVIPASKYPDLFKNTIFKSSSRSSEVFIEMAGDKSAVDARKKFVESFDEYVQNNQKDKNNIRFRMTTAGSAIKSEQSPIQNIELKLPLGNFFQDDSAEITDSQALENDIISAISQLSEDIPESNIGLATYRLIATTSKVPSTVYFNKGGNEALAEARAAAIKQVVNTALTKTNVFGSLNDVKPEQLELGERGPEYDRNKYSKDKRKDPIINAEYEKTYGPHRRTEITLVFQIQSRYKEKEESVNNYSWEFYITGKPQRKPPLTKIRFGKIKGGGLFSRKGSPVACPFF